MQNTELNIIASPEKISCAGQNLINITSAISFVILSLILVVVYYVTGQKEIPTLALAIFGLIELIAFSFIINQLRKAGKNLRGSYTTNMNGRVVSLSEVDFYNELNEKNSSHSETQVEVSDKCPACSEPIRHNEVKCESCGLAFK